MDTVSLIYWTHEGDELAWNDPIKVSVLNFLVMFVLFCIICLKVVPTATNTLLQSFKAVKDCTFIEAISFASISEWFEVWLVDLKLPVRLFCVHLEDDNHESAHKEASIRDLGKILTCTVMIDSCVALE